MNISTSLKYLSRCFAIAALMPSAVLAAASSADSADSYRNFESHQFRPLALSLSGDYIYVANTPDNRIEIFDLSGKKPVHAGEVMTGLEPVALAARSDSELWVVNHLSDSVSIVDTSVNPPQIKQTLYVGDEPRDIVFGGKDNRYAFITAAHRGQNSPYTDPDNPGELTTPGIGRADIWIFDADKPGKDGGKPILVKPLFGDSPGPLAVTPDGSRVYAGVFKSGNQTTIVGRVLVCRGGANAKPCETAPDGPVAPGGLPAPNKSVEGIRQPGVGIIVKWDGEGWKDELDRDWSDVIKLDLPDYDVFEINALKPADEARSFATVGTILYAMAVNPATGELFVANTDAINEVRFEGVRSDEREYTTVQGHLHETRITVVDPEQGAVSPHHLNTHINYEQFPVPATVREKTLSMPVAVEFSGDGKLAYVAAKGSDKVAVIDAARLAKGQYDPAGSEQIVVPGGPAGLVLDEARGKLYALTRFNNSLVVINTKKNTVDEVLPLFSPEPDAVIAGRPFFFNAALTSGNGESSCASCHVAGDKDELAWDLGDPMGAMLENPSRVIGPLRGRPKFHPMKGPMLTQTMRGLENHGPLHWRGDRTAGNDPGGDPLDTAGGMTKFNQAFVSLMGREETLNEAQLQLLVAYSMSMVPPPNPIRALDNSLTPKQAAGKDFFQNYKSVMGMTTCSSCHVLSERRGYYGTKGDLTHIIGGRLTKIPHHRNTYERVGMFGRAASTTLLEDTDHMGAQIRGYGFTHDGGADTTIRFMSYPAFQFPEGNKQRREVEQYLFAYESNLRPVVGQQVTLSSDSGAQLMARAGLLVERAQAGDADLVLRTVVDGRQKGYLMQPDGTFLGDSLRDEAVTVEQIREQGAAITLTAVPRGWGTRIALDRNDDGVRDGDGQH